MSNYKMPVLRTQRRRLAANNLVLAACREGAGFSMQPHALVSRDLAEGRLVIMRPQMDDQSDYYIVTQPGPVGLRIKVFIDWLLSNAAAG